MIASARSNANEVVVAQTKMGEAKLSPSSEQSLEVALAAIVGQNHLFAGAEAARFERDWRGRYQGKARVVVRPGKPEEVIAVMQACAAHRVAVVAQGGNTGLVGGSVPDGSGRQVVLSLARLNRVREVDAANSTMTVEAGCILQAAQEAAAAHGLLLPLSLAAEGSCTIGGNLATNAGGTQVLRYGNARELCLGLEVVLADGALWPGLSGLRKDNTGYDLRNLFIGSEGTLGIITAATLKLYPLPASKCTAMVALPSLEAAVAWLQQAQAQWGAGLTAFEIMGKFALDLTRQHFPDLPAALPPSPWTALVEYSSSEAFAIAQPRFESVLEKALEDGFITDAAIATSQAQSRSMWHCRESIPLAQGLEGLNIKHDISVPISRIPEFVARTDALLQMNWPGVRLVNFGHLGDGNLHYNVQAPPGQSANNFLADHEAAVNRLVYDEVLARGGSISAEHGIGALKRDELARSKSPVALQLMRSIKLALDPDNRLNPGRVL